MPKTPIASALSYIKYSTVSHEDIAANGKTIVCLRTWSWSTSNDISDEDTFCGSWRSVGSAIDEISGEGLAVDDGAAGEASAQDIKVVQNAKSKIYFIAENTALSPVTAGGIAYLKSTGYFSDSEVTFDHPGMAGFSFTIAVNSADNDLVP